MRLLLILLPGLLPIVAGCAKDAPAAAAKSSPPAHVEAHPNESQIFHVSLSEQAVERLGIETAEIERRPMPRRRTYGGEVVIPTGNLVVVAAPAAGTLENPRQGGVPAPGTPVEAGQPVFRLLPFLSPERYFPTPAERVQMANAEATLISSQIIAEGDVQRAEAEVEAARIAVDRATQLLKDMVGSARALDDATAALNVATASQEAAKQRSETLRSLSLQGASGQMQHIEIVVPEAGILHDVTATRGQTVTAGAPLFQIADLSTVWVRVPIYVGQVDEIDPGGDAKLQPLGGDQQSPGHTARPVTAPPSADVMSSTAHLYYSVENADGRLRPGERIGVSLPLRGENESLVIASAAVLYDINGTAWVYQQVEPRVFARRRVLVRYATTVNGSDAELAVLAEGPEAGTEVVVAGAAELFGTEFGSGH